GAIGHRATPSCDLQHSLGHSDRPSGEVRNTRSRLATPPVTDGVASLEVLVRTPACSVHVAHVPLLALEGGDVLDGLLVAHTAVLGDDLVQRTVDVLGHPRRIAADVEVSTLLEPREQL